MCIYGNIMKKQIKEEKEKNAEKFIEIEEALKSEEKDPDLFALGLLSKNLNSIGIESVIERKGTEKKGLNEEGEENQNEESKDDEQDEATTCLQFIYNGLCQKKNMN